jgi:hypothetical protein
MSRKHFPAAVLVSIGCSVVYLRSHRQDELSETYLLPSINAAKVHDRSRRRSRSVAPPSTGRSESEHSRARRTTPATSRPPSRTELVEFCMTIDAAIWVRNADVSAPIPDEFKGLFDGRLAHVSERRGIVPPNAPHVQLEQRKRLKNLDYLRADPQPSFVRRTQSEIEVFYHHAHRPCHNIPWLPVLSI